jgi:hypothetical protein
MISKIDRLALLKELWAKTEKKEVKVVPKELTGLVNEEQDIEVVDEVISTDKIHELLGAPKFEDAALEDDYDINDNNE